jgi:hypothetical protein
MIGVWLSHSLIKLIYYPILLKIIPVSSLNRLMFIFLAGQLLSIVVSLRFSDELITYIWTYLLVSAAFGFYILSLTKFWQLPPADL